MLTGLVKVGPGAVKVHFGLVKVGPEAEKCILGLSKWALKE